MGGVCNNYILLQHTLKMMLNLVTLGGGQRAIRPTREHEHRLALSLRIGGSCIHRDAGEFPLNGLSRVSSKRKKESEGSHLATLDRWKRTETWANGAHRLRRSQR